MSHSDDPPRDGPPGNHPPAFQPGGGVSHPDDDTLAVLALGEEVDRVVAAHVASCVQCGAEIQSYSRVVLAGRALEPADAPLVMPPRAVWDRIAADIGLDPALLPLQAPPSEHAGPDREFDDPASARPPAPVDLDARRTSTGRARSRAGLLVAASVAGALLGVGATLSWQALDDPDTVAFTVLEPLPGKAASGEVKLVGTGEKRELNLLLDTDAPDDAYLQVWLMSPDLQRMVPVGVLEDGVGFWRVPAELDIDEFPVVDVSIEPFDGNAAHSTDSLVRGQLIEG